MSEGGRCTGRKELGWKGQRVGETKERIKGWRKQERKDRRRKEKRMVRAKGRTTTTTLLNNLMYILALLSAFHF